MTDWQSLLGETLRHAEISRIETGEAMHAYLLVDFRNRAELAAPIKSSAQVSHGSVWLGTDLAVYGEIAPLLIEIDDLTRFELGRDTDGPYTSELLRLLRRVYEADGGQFAVTHILSPMALAELMAHCAYYGDYGLPDGREYYLHFYDSRILDRAFQVWSEAERERFLAPLTLMRYLRRDGSIAEWKGGGERELSAAALPAPQPFTLAQHQALLDMDYPDKLTQQIRRIYMGVLGSDLRQDELHEQVLEQMARARAYGIESERDMLDYVAWGITISPRFDEHEVIQSALRAFKGSGLSQALEDVPDDVWDGLLRERTGNA
ncbi:DUF4123 domain-containing protein [Achromobacter sp. ACM03]|uniref:DUF4123 domain-containing protein n=1 Tax=Achromobacter TaxID=222 RepID=UPI00146801A9|nr:MULTISPECIES: DUF4123 domain-containing protein [Achromobacter]MBD9430592.1 DUF4123 domain-containing protein [Achromobacter sp. ACM03]MBD9472158.1 DUF4123 domain-containing protein [Achromobacter sp. ACM01]CAB3628029.1 hypothetical protein LMG26852_00685 [Achromobacter aegrifaciens]